MHLKRYEVAEMGEAIAQIKRDLGSDAIVLSTRTIRKRSGLFRLVSKPMLEVIAAVDRPLTADIHTGAVEARRSTGMLPRRSSALEAAGPDATMEMAALRAELRGLRQELQTLRGKGEDRPMPAPQARHLPQRLAQLHAQLVSKGIAADIAAQLLEEVRWARPAAALNDETTLEALVKRAMLDKIKAAVPCPASSAAPRLVALVGPTGVGKTTTIAKLAAIASLTERQRVALITLDTYRIAAAEQLKVYGNIIGVPVLVATTSQEFRSALAQTRNCDAVFVDTAGRCHRNREQMGELQELLTQPQPLEIHLALSATTREEDLQEMIRQFEVLPLSSLLFTKLDESASLGSLFNLAVRTTRPLSYLTTGQRVPDDVEIATPARIVDFLWHGFWR
jgi:flagellar biosynthesis protein FlhF